MHGETLSFLLTGALLGLTAGISPGPLLALVISESMRHGTGAGIRIALAPLVTDPPIIALVALALFRLSRYGIVLGLISLLGAAFIVYLGYGCVKTKGPDAGAPGPGSLKKGILANIMNPHPYLFWMTVGIPVALKAYRLHPGAAALYFLSLYALLVGSKIGIAVLAGRAGALVTGRGYVWIMRALGVSLFLFAAFFLYDGIRLLRG